MSTGFFQVPVAKNEPVLSYAPGSGEREALQKTLTNLKSEQIDIPMFIGGEEVFTNDKRTMHPPHEHKHTLGTYSYGDKSHVEAAINASLKAKADWENMSWEHRASIFLRAAELAAGPYRMLLNAATMLCQSKNAYQAEIDAACEWVDFLKFNVEYMTEIYSEQPESTPGIWNRLEYRPLEGFVLAITPFNFTAISGNLPAAAAMMGNTVVWKPSDTQIYSAWVIMKLLRHAGLPDGVINMIYTDGPVCGDTCLAHKDFAGLHFTGSTGTFQHLWKQIGNNIHNYRAYPRIVGETGGKDFVLAHKSADPTEVAVGLLRGAFEFQGQKCSAASRAYIPKSLWPTVQKYLVEDLKTLKMGTTEDFGNFINAVIDERSFDKIAAYIDGAKADGQEIIAGGNYDKSEGYFVEPTVIVTEDPMYKTMCEEIFGPVLTIFVYDDADWDKTLDIVANSNDYALTGAIFSECRYSAEHATKVLRHAAGNFYINDKPTGAVVGQQPFGGGRASGTNDKAGSKLNLLRWVSPRTIKETFVPAVDYRYPFLG